MQNNVDLFLIVKVAIDEWDPVNLLSHAPNDEYDIESELIAKKLFNNISSLEIAEIISSVFSKSFGEVFTVEKCAKPATEIFELIK